MKSKVEVVLLDCWVDIISSILMFKNFQHLEFGLILWTAKNGRTSLFFVDEGSTIHVVEVDYGLVAVFIHYHGWNDVAGGYLGHVRVVCCLILEIYCRQTLEPGICNK